MKARRLYANPRVRDNAGCAAFAWGPLVYCFEGADNPAPLCMLRVKREALPRIQPFDPNLLGGVRTLKIEGLRLSMPEGALYREEPPRQEDRAAHLTRRFSRLRVKFLVSGPLKATSPTRWITCLPQLATWSPFRFTATPQPRLKRGTLSRC